MSRQALYRKWRSQTFDQVIAQEHVTRTLQNALRAGRIAHAYLFCGPRGTGKTSTARILAKAVNCLAEPAQRPCNECARCQAVSEGRDLDLIEIDAASNRGIDEIRDLRDKIAFSPNEGRYKVYVVDEVHMLTTEAFNALLKTLEEPPPHVIFVLATTEPQKIPATILSRCQRFDFRRIPLADLKSKLDTICQAEGIVAEPSALEAIARRAGGSFRDAESLLDQLAATGDEEITLDRVRDLLGGVSLAAVGDVVQAWIAGDLGAGLRLINRLVDEGAEARQLHLEVVEYLRSLLLLQAGGDERIANVSPEMAMRMRQQLVGLPMARLVDALRLFGQGEAGQRSEVRPQLPLEMAFTQAVLAASQRVEERQPAPAAAPASRPAARPASPPARPVSREAPRRAPQAAPKAGPAPDPASQPAAALSPVAPGEFTLSLLLKRWPDILLAARPRDPKLPAFLRGCTPVEVSGERVVLAAQPFHRDRLMEEKNRATVEALLAQLAGAPCHMECILASERPARASRRPAIVDPEVHEDPIVRYAVEDLGAQVSKVEAKDASTTPEQEHTQGLGTGDQGLG